jgi:hypothetical protein
MITPPPPQEKETKTGYFAHSMHKIPCTKKDPGSKVPTGEHFKILKKNLI